MGTGTDNSTTFLANYPTTGTAAGMIDVQLFEGLASGTYDLRLLSPDPKALPLFHVIARSEPLYVQSVLTGVKLISVLDERNLLHLRLAGPATGFYKLEVTDSLDSPNWQMVANLTTAVEYTEPVVSNSKRRFFRASQ